MNSVISSNQIVCPLSGDPMKPFLHVSKDWRRPNVVEDYQIYWADSVDYGAIYPRPTQEEVSEFYDVEDYYTHLEANSANAEADDGFFWKVLRHLAWRFDWGAEPSLDWWRDTLGQTSLDCCEIGSGNGANLLLLRDLGHNVVGLEPDSAARCIARANGLSVFEGTAEKLPNEISGQKYDIVILMHVLEHCLDPLRALESAAGLMKNGSRLILEVPNNSCWGLRLNGPGWPWLDVPRHLNFFTERSLLTAVRKTGLQVVGVNYRGYARQFSKGWVLTEKRISRILSGLHAQELVLERKDFANSLLLLFLTFLAKSPRKYDSVRVIAQLK